MQSVITEKQSDQINTLNDETKKRAHDPQIVRAKENLLFVESFSFTGSVCSISG